jgi:hypothetical protein
MTSPQQMPSAHSRSASRRRVVAAPSALIALCVAVLHLATALHFALVPHGFCAGLGGFVHVHASAQTRAATSTQVERRAEHQRPSVVADSASCETDLCSLGYTGHGSVLLPAGGSVIEEVARADVDARVLRSRQSCSPIRVLFSAPKTSPPV